MSKEKKLHRTDYSEDLRTICQWEKQRKVPISKEDGLLLWVNWFHKEKQYYYSIEQVRDMLPEELEELNKKNREKRKEYKRRAAERERLKKEEEECRIKEKIEHSVERALYLKGKELGEELIKLANTLPCAPINLNADLVVVDVETTGSNCDVDEVLQLSIINGNGEVLFNSYVQPYKINSWNEAELIHGIKPDDVKNAPYPHDVIPAIKGIFEKASLVIGYNLSFDIGFLEKWGLDFSSKEIYDVMTEFASIYGEWNDYFQDYKWQKLQTCAAYYGYIFNAHDSLEDVKATLFCYNKINQEF